MKEPGIPTDNNYFSRQAKEIQLMVGYNADRKSIEAKLKEIALAAVYDSHIQQEAEAS